MAFHIEAPLNDYAEKESSFNDREALLTLEYVREKIAKGKGLVIMPGKTGLPQNELGEAIYHMIERCRFEGRIILTGKPLAYSTDEKLRVLDRLMGTLKHLAAGNIEGRAYIQAVAMRFAELKGRGSPSKKVFTIT